MVGKLSQTTFTAGIRVDIYLTTTTADDLLTAVLEIRRNVNWLGCRLKLFDLGSVLREIYLFRIYDGGRFR